MKKFVPIFAAAALMATSAAFAQTTTSPGAATTTPTAPLPSVKTPSAPLSSATVPSMGERSGMTMTETEAQTWLKKPLYSSDNKNVGDITAVDRDATGKVTSLEADIGGFLGMGSTRVRISPAQFALGTDRITLNMTSAQAKDLPKVVK